MTYNKLFASAAVISTLVLGGIGLTTPSQAANYSFTFGSGVMHNGAELRFRNGHFDNGYCLSNGEISSQLRANGFRSVQIVRSLGRHAVLAVGRKGTHWYQLVVNSCTGAVDQQIVRRGSNGNFSFSFSFGGNGGFNGDGFPGGMGNGGPGNGGNGGPGHGGNGGPGHGGNGGSGNGGNGGPGNGGNGGPGNGGNHEKLVCYVTFFNASQVAAGADANVESAQVMPQSQAQAIDRSNDRSAIFDYGSDQQTISTCNYLDHLN